MGGKAKTPKAPNYSALAKEQAGLAGQQWQQELGAARPDQTTPFGSVNWAKDPTTGEWTQTTSLAPEYEALRQQQAGLQGQVGDLIGQNLGGLDVSQVDLSGASALPTVGGYNEQAIATIRALQAPELARARARKEAQLAAMGVGTGTGQAWNAEQGNLAEAENRADLNAIMSGIQQGNVEFGQGLQLNQADINNMLRQRQANLAQTQGLMGLAGPQVGMPELPGFATPSGGGQTVPNLMNAAQSQYQAKLDKANAKGGGFFNTLLGTVGGIAGNMLGGPFGAKVGTGLSGLFGLGGGGSQVAPPAPSGGFAGGTGILPSPGVWGY